MDAGPAFRTIRLDVNELFIWEDGGTTFKGDPAAVPSALVVTEDGGELSFPGMIVDAGLMVIPGVPTGYAMIQFAPTSWLDTASDTVDFGNTFLGRLNAAGGGAGTALRLQLTSLAPWNPTYYSTLDFICPNTHALYPGFQKYAGPLPDGGSPVLSGGATSADINVQWGTAPLIDATQGDVVRILQSTNETIGAPGTAAGYAFTRNIQSFAELPPFSMLGGGTTTVAAALSPVPRNSTINVDLRRSETAAMAAAVNPNAQVLWSIFFLSTTPLGVLNGGAMFEYGPQTLLEVSGPATDSTDLAVSIPYGNPFPASWPLVGGAWADFTTTHALAGGQLVTVHSLASTWDEGTALQTGPHRLLTSPPTQLAIDGQSGDLTLAGPRPLVTWGAPATGVPNQYLVSVLRLFLSGTTPTYEESARVRTTRRSVRIPRGVFLSGQRYVLTVYATTDSGSDLSSRPFRPGGFPYSYAPVVSGTLIMP